MTYKLVVILKNGRTVVLTSNEDKNVLVEQYQQIYGQIKQDWKFVEFDNNQEKVIVSTDEIAAVMISEKENGEKPKTNKDEQ